VRFSVENWLYLGTESGILAFNDMKVSLTLDDVEGLQKELYRL